MGLSSVLKTLKNGPGVQKAFAKRLQILCEPIWTTFLNQNLGVYPKDEVMLSIGYAYEIMGYWHILFKNISGSPSRRLFWAEHTF